MNTAPRKNRGITPKLTSPSITLVLTSIMAVAAHAQTPAPAPEASDEVVKLNPFLVDASYDSGYTASNSISATRSNTPIKDLPLNIQVFTPELAQDILARTQFDLQRYNASLQAVGLDSQSDNNIQQGFNAFYFRGFRQNWGLRDGNRTYDPVDMAGIDRVELIKGPAGAVYGPMYAGGTMNIITKQALFNREFSKLETSIDNNGGLRAQIDSNYNGMTKGGNFAARINGAYAKTEDAREHSEGSVRFTQLNIALKPFEKTEIRFVSESGSREKPVALGYFTATETDASGANYDNQSSIPLQILHPEIPWTWNWAVGNMRTSEATLNRLTVTQEINKDFFVNAYWHASSRRNIDSQGWLGGGGTPADASWDVGPSWRTIPVTGNETALGLLVGPNWMNYVNDNKTPTVTTDDFVPYTNFPSGWINPGNKIAPSAANYPGPERIQYGWLYRDWQNHMHAYGANAVYKFDAASTRNTISAGVNVWSERFVTFRQSQPTGTTNLISFPVRAGINLATPATPPPDIFTDTRGGWQRENNSNDYYYLNWQMAAMDNRLNITAGVSKSNIRKIAWGTGFTTTPDSDVSTSKTSPMIGTLYKITKDVSVFATYSSSIFPTSEKNAFGTLLADEVGKSIDAVVKADALEGKISGTFSVYKIKKTGGSQFDPGVETPNSLAWDTLTPAQRLIQFPNITSRSQLQGDNINGNIEGNGVEIDLVVTPFKNWQTLFSFAYNKTEITQAFTRSFVGRVPYNGAPPTTQFAVLSKYSFTEGAAKGLSAGLGFNHSGKSLQDYNGPGSSGRYSPSTLNVDLFGSYRFTAFGYSQLVQLNVRNALEEDLYVGWKATGSSSRISTERYATPTKRTISLTYGIDF